MQLNFVITFIYIHYIYVAMRVCSSIQCVGSYEQPRKLMLNTICRLIHHYWILFLDAII